MELRTLGSTGTGEDPNQSGNSRRWIMREVENSLRRLGTDWIDLYQIHRPEPDTDVDETLGALSDLVRAGNVHEPHAAGGERTGWTWSQTSGTCTDACIVGAIARSRSGGRTSRNGTGGGGRLVSPR